MSHLAKTILAKLQQIPAGEVGKTADLVGVSREQFTRWRRGRLPLNPTLANLERLSEVLGLKLTLTDAGGEVVAEAGSDYPAAGTDLRQDFEEERQRLRSRIRRLEEELGINSGR